jgi:1,4-dihydroxy-2-naphthoate octaprenyltransferase
VRAARLPYISASLIPTALGLAVVIDRDDAVWWLAPLVLIAAGAVHIGTNVVNGVEDCVRGVDTVDMHGDARTFVDGELSVARGRWFYRALFAIAAVLGVLFAIVTGPAILPIGILGIVVGWAYTAGPFPFKYHALGDLVIVFFMGPLMSQGAFTAMTGDLFDTDAFLAGFVPGLLIEAVLAANNLADLDEDRRAGVRTLATVTGAVTARRLYVASLASAYALLVVLVATGILGWPCLAVLATVPMAWQRVRLASQGTGDALAPLAPLTALVHLVAGVLLVALEAISRGWDLYLV